MGGKGPAGGHAEQRGLIIGKSLSLNFVLDDGMRQTIARAQRDYDAFIDSIDIAVTETDVVNPSWMKENGLGADAMQQMAFQLAYATFTGGNLP